MRIVVLLAVAALLPVAAAQNESTDELPTGVGPPGPDESLGERQAIPFGVFVVLITLALAGALMWVTYKQRRNPPPGRRLR